MLFQIVIEKLKVAHYEILVVVTLRLIGVLEHVVVNVQVVYVLSL